MYKYLIIGIAFMFIASSLHYIKKSGGDELIINAITSNQPDNFIPPTISSVTGVYVCDGESGCNNKYILLLKEDGTAEMILLPEESTDTETESEEKNTQVRNSIIVNETLKDSEPGAMSTVSTSTNDEPSTPESNVAVLTATPTDENTTSAELSNLFSPDTTNLGSTSVIDKGNWSLAVQNMLVVTLKEQGTTTYDVPQKLVVKNVGASTLSRISYTKSVYSDMINPTFVKQE